MAEKFGLLCENIRMPTVYQKQQQKGGIETMDKKYYLTQLDVYSSGIIRINKILGGVLSWGLLKDTTDMDEPVRCSLCLH
jgi:hypothetical protein